MIIIQRRHSCKTLININGMVEEEKESQAITDHNKVHVSPGKVHQCPSSVTEDVLHLWIQSTKIHRRYLGGRGVQAQVYQMTLIALHHIGKGGWVIG